jgi:hypothetical protein
MKPLRFLAASFAAALLALGLSVGAAMAEGKPEPLKAGQSAPKGLCILHDLAS